VTETTDLFEPLLADIRDMDEQVQRRTNLRGHEDEAVRTYRAALWRLRMRGQTLRYLGSTSTEFTVALVDDLLIIAGNDGDFGSVAELLGRLAFDHAQELVPPAVFKRLEADDVDYGDWFRMADLLNYLGLYDALRELVAKARDHIDGDVREVASTYGDV
jgi:hypothetical protein